MSHPGTKKTSIATAPRDDTGKTRDLGPFKQGINVNSMKNFYSGLTPRLSAGNRPNVVISGKTVGYQVDLLPAMVRKPWFDDSISSPPVRQHVDVASKCAYSISDAGSRVDLVPNFEMEQMNFGQSKTFLDDNIYVDAQPADGRLAYNPAAHMEKCADYLSWPTYMMDTTSAHQYDGVIELFGPIRASAALRSIDFRGPAAGGTSRLEGGYAEDSRGRGILIHQFIHSDVTDSFEPYEDGVEFFDPPMSPLPGFLTDAESYTPAWVDSTDWDDKVDELESNKILGRRDEEMASIFLTSRESTKDFRPRSHRSATAGFYYDNALEGTDSIAFGGLKK